MKKGLGGSTVTFINGLGGGTVTFLYEIIKKKKLWLCIILKFKILHYLRFKLNMKNAENFKQKDKFLNFILSMSINLTV